MTETVQRIKILIGRERVDGCLIYHNDALLAVLSFEEPLARWAVEAVFDELDTQTTPETFSDPDEASAWFGNAFR
jgi:hypothetical protein